MPKVTESHQSKRSNSSSMDMVYLAHDSTRNCGLDVLTHFKKLHDSSLTKINVEPRHFGISAFRMRSPFQATYRRTALIGSRCFGHGFGSRCSHCFGSCCFGSYCFGPYCFGSYDFLDSYYFLGSYCFGSIASAPTSSWGPIASAPFGPAHSAPAQFAAGTLPQASFPPAPFPPAYFAPAPSTSAPTTVSSDPVLPWPSTNGIAKLADYSTVMDPPRRPVLLWNGGGGGGDSGSNLDLDVAIPESGIPEPTAGGDSDSNLDLDGDGDLDVAIPDSGIPEPTAGGGKLASVDDLMIDAGLGDEWQYAQMADIPAIVSMPHFGDESFWAHRDRMASVAKRSQLRESSAV